MPWRSTLSRWSKSSLKGSFLESPIGFVAPSSPAPTKHLFLHQNHGRAGLINEPIWEMRLNLIWRGQTSGTRADSATNGHSAWITRPPANARAANEGLEKKRHARDCYWQPCGNCPKKAKGLSLMSREATWNEGLSFSCQSIMRRTKGALPLTFTVR